MKVPIFDLDGTLLDSDEALVAPFVELGVPREAIGFGEPVGVACQRLGVSLDDYVAAYDASAVEPYPGVEDLLAALDRWAIFSNKHPRAAAADLARWGWRPAVALFTDAFEGRAKRVEPVLELLELAPPDVVVVGDSEHDAAAAAEAGCAFLVAGWNPRTAALTGHAVLGQPLDLRDWLEEA